MEPAVTRRQITTSPGKLLHLSQSASCKPYFDSDTVAIAFSSNRLNGEPMIGWVAFVPEKNRSTVAIAYQKIQISVVVVISYGKTARGPGHQEGSSVIGGDVLKVPTGVFE